MMLEREFEARDQSFPVEPNQTVELESSRARKRSLAEVLHTPKEETISRREVSRENDLEGSSNEVRFVELKDDGSVIFKPARGEKKLRKELKEGTYFKRERAAYLVDRFLNFGLVPPTVIREIGGETGSVQEFIPDVSTFYEVKYDQQENMDTLKKNNELLKLWIFDWIIWNSDRHGDNFLIKNDKIIAIDNGLSFGRETWTRFAGGFKFFNQSMPEDIIKKFSGIFRLENRKGNIGRFVA